MTDEELEKEAAELLEMIKTLRLIKDRNQRKRFKAEIRYMVIQMLNY